MEIEMKPTENRIIVRREENPYVKPVRKSGIVVPDLAKSGTSGKFEQQTPMCWYAKILEVGPEVTTMGPGDGILFSPHAGYPVEFYEDEWIVLRDKDVIVKFESNGEDILLGGGHSHTETTSDEQAGDDGDKN